MYNVVRRKVWRNKMKVTTDKKGTIILQEIYNGVVLQTKHGEEIAICMRDSGFEFRYMDNWYSAQKGKLKTFKEK
jgi:hypothetical protein